MHNIQLANIAGNQKQGKVFSMFVFFGYVVAIHFNILFFLIVIMFVDIGNHNKNK